MEKEKLITSMAIFNIYVTLQEGMHPSITMHVFYMLNANEQ